MSEDHAFDRFTQAQPPLDQAKQAIRSSLDVIDAVGLTLSASPPSLTIDEHDWPTFAQLRRLVQDYEEALAEGQEAWAGLDRQQQRSIHRGSPPRPRPYGDGEHGQTGSAQ